MSTGRLELSDVLADARHVAWPLITRRADLVSHPPAACGPGLGRLMQNAGCKHPHARKGAQRAPPWSQPQPPTSTEGCSACPSWPQVVRLPVGSNTQDALGSLTSATASRSQPWSQLPAQLSSPKPSPHQVAAAAGMVAAVLMHDGFHLDDSNGYRFNLSESGDQRSV